MRQPLQANGVLIMKKQNYGVMLIGEEHARAIYDRPDVRMVAVIDADENRAQVFRRRFGAQYCGMDYRPFLLGSEVDIVLLAVNARSHAPILLDCLAAGKHVLCEKPLAPDEESLNRCAEAIRSANSQVLVGHILRHSPAYQLVRRLIDDGKIGRPQLFRMIQNHQCVDWVRYQKLLEDCTPLVDCGVHYIDVTQWFTSSRVTEIGGMAARIDTDSPRNNYAMLTMKTESGVSAFFECVWSRHAVASNVKEFIGTKGCLRISPGCDRPCAHNKGDLVEYIDGETDAYEQYNLGTSGKNMTGQFEHLLNMIEKGTPAAPTLEEVLRAQRIAFAADRAAGNASPYGTRL